MTAERFAQTLARAKSRLQPRTGDASRQILSLLETIASPHRSLKRLAVRSAGKTLFVDVEDIDWIEAAENYVQLHVGRAAHLLHVTMNTLEESLNPEIFVDSPLHYGQRSPHQGTPTRRARGVRGHAARRCAAGVRPNVSRALESLGDQPVLTLWQAKACPTPVGQIHGPVGQVPLSRRARPGHTGHAMNESCLAQLSGVTKRFESVTALDELDLEVRPGELLALLGPNVPHYDSPALHVAVLGGVTVAFALFAVRRLAY